MNKHNEIKPTDTEFAGEYVLRVLPDGAHSAAAARAVADPAFAAEVQLWEDRLAALTDEIMPVPPSIKAKTVLMDRLFGLDEKRGVWSTIGFWKAVSGLLTVVVAALVTVVIR